MSMNEWKKNGRKTDGEKRFGSDYMYILCIYLCDCIPASISIACFPFLFTSHLQVKHIHSHTCTQLQTQSSQIDENRHIAGAFSDMRELSRYHRCCNHSCLHHLLLTHVSVCA